MQPEANAAQRQPTDANADGQQRSDEGAANGHRSAHNGHGASTMECTSYWRPPLASDEAAMNARQITPR